MKATSEMLTLVHHYYFIIAYFCIALMRQFIQYSFTLIFYNMKKIILLICCIIATTVFSCTDKYNDVEVQKSPKAHTFIEDLEITKKFMTIDTVNYSYSVIITDSIILAENISEDNLVQILSNIDELNKKIKESIQKGEVTTLYITTKDKFKSFTVGTNSHLSFSDEKGTTGSLASTRGYPSMSFYAGNWQISSSKFDASDKVTSFFAVDYCRGYWQATFKCTTGNSANGNTFTTYGSGITYGKINRYWWITNGGTSYPYHWNFDANAPVGGEASGMVTFADTY
jgi:hypothetical protein